MTSGRGFKDHFSNQSAGYARHRPHYPAELFTYLARLTRQHTLAWDCATGSGQAAIALSRHYDKVIATDASDSQIDAAVAHDLVDYRVATAEKSGIEAGSVDLLTVGQALHWFDIERFSGEATRVLVAGGVLSAWCYERCAVNEACDALIDRLYSDIVGEFWPPERRLIESRYEGVSLPGEAIPSPSFAMAVSWLADDMLGYLRTWSACIRYERKHGADPVDRIADALRTAWGEAPRVVSWPLVLRVSRVN